MARGRTKAPAARKLPRQPRAQVTVDAIVTAVERVLEQHGAAGLTTNRVAEIAGVSIGSLYQYFPNKEALVGAVIERYVGHTFAQCSAAVAASGALPLPAAVERVAFAITTAYANLRPIHRWLIDLRTAAAFHERFRRALDGLVAEVAAALAARADVRLADPPATAFVLVHGIAGIVDAVGARELGADVGPIVAEAARLVRVFLEASAP